MSTPYADSSPLTPGEGEVILVGTPGPARTFRTWEDARAWAEAGVPTLKRGWTVTWESHEGYPARRYLRVRNSRGRLVTGAVASVRGAVTR